MKTLLLLLLLLPMTALGANRPVQFHWEHPTENVSNEPLDANGDGDLSEGLTGYNLYLVACNDINHQPPDTITCASLEDNERIDIMVADIEPWTVADWNGSFNLPFNPVDTSRQPVEQHCFVATAYWRGPVEQADGSMVTETHESANSGIVCKPWVRQTPKPPKNMRRTF
jgi:hypothetical protein